MPTIPSTFRASYVSGLLSILDEFATAHGDLLRSTWRTRPPSFDIDLPAAWVGRGTVTISHAGQLRERVVPIEVFVVDRLTDNDETLARFDTLVDLLVDHFTDHPHLVANTVWDRMTVDDDFEDGFWLVRFRFDNHSEMTGRL